MIHVLLLVRRRDLHLRARTLAASWPGIRASFVGKTSRAKQGLALEQSKAT